MAQNNFPFWGAQGGRAAALLLACVARHTSEERLASHPALRPPKWEIILGHVLSGDSSVFTIP